MLMKLFKKSIEKKKKPLSDKAKEERKQKIKKIVKRVLDILVYGFTIFMIFGLLVGSCNSRAKVVSAYYHTDNGYTSLPSVIVDNTSTSLRYYYDYNSSKTFPSWSTLFSVLPGTNAFGLVRLENSISVDGDNLVYLQAFHHPSGYYTLSLRTDDDVFPQANIVLIEVYTDRINVARPDLFTAIFNGNYRVFVNNHTTNNDNFFRWLAYYFGELGYNRITYSFPLNIASLGYLFVNSDNNDTLIENGYFFKNSEFDFSIDYDETPYPLQVSVIYNVFVGSFRVNGVYYSTISFNFSSVYGARLTENNRANIAYYMPGSDTYINSLNEFYKGYWYIDSITYSGFGNSTLVYRTFNEISGGTATGQGLSWRYDFVNNWVGDSYYSSSPYRDLYIYYVYDALSGSVHHPFTDYFPQLSLYTYADFLNYIGDAYPSGNAGVPSDTSAPFTSVFEWLKIALAGAMPFFGYTLLPGITIGTLIMIPITMSIILFVVKLFKR